MSTPSKEIYAPENVPLFEAMYGPGLISLGGYVAVDLMFNDMNLCGKKLLDVGSGIGGMAHYLAQKYVCDVTGLEVHPWMAEHALAKAPVSIKDRVNFVTYTSDGKIPLPLGSFDIIYSKGVFTNIKDKASLFSALFQLLKPVGQICLMDWIVSYGPIAENLTTGEPSYKETEASYYEILTQCGFTNISFKNDNKAYLDYVKELGKRLMSENHKKRYQDIMNDDLREMLIVSNEKLLNAMEKGEQISMLIKAEKK